MKGAFTVSEQLPRGLRRHGQRRRHRHPPEQQDKIFQPFHRAGQETGPIEGTGIGLAISKRLAELMFGAASASQHTGRWIRVLDRAPGSSAKRSRVAARRAARSAKQASRLASQGRAPFVYVEDNPSNIAFMGELMGELEDVQLISVPNAEIGIELVRARQPDVVIMDINLPGMSGYEATRRLQGVAGDARYPRDRPQRGRHDERLLGKSRCRGFSALSTKPIDVGELLYHARCRSPLRRADAQ